MILCEIPIGILCIVISFIANDESLVLLQIILAMVVRLFVALAIKILFTLTAELFPTPGVSHGGLIYQSPAHIYSPDLLSSLNRLIPRGPRSLTRDDCIHLKVLTS